MIPLINEKALLKLMKSAYKGGGLRVARQDRPGLSTDCLALRAGHWAVLLPMDAAPGKVLGLLAEWMRELPLIGQSWLLLSGEEPERQAEPDNVLAALQNAARAGLYCQGMKPAGLTLRECDVFQLGDGEILLFAPDLLDLVRSQANMGLYCAAVAEAYWQDEETGTEVWLWASLAPGSDGLIEHLAGFNFWAPQKGEDA